MYLEHILQADQGCDFDFLRGRTRDTEAAFKSFRNPAM
jgi:hypothetical protein